MIDYSQFDRRTFLRRGAMGAGALWAASLAPFMARRAEGAAIPSPYGDIFPTADETTGLQLLRLPAGFRYRSYSWTGDVMADDVRCPNLHDGMAVVDAQGNSGRIILVRNHEGGAGTPYLNKPSITYRNDAAGGTTNLIFNLRQGTWEKDWSTLAGTNRNCAGGVTPWGTWITGEETTDAGHGWSFDVGPAERRSHAAEGDGPLLARSDDGRSGTAATSTRPKTPRPPGSTASSRTSLASSTRVASCTC